MAQFSIYVAQVLVDVIRDGPFRMHLVRPIHHWVALEREIDKALSLGPQHLLREARVRALGWKPARSLQAWGALHQGDQYLMQRVQVVGFGLCPFAVLAHMAYERLGRHTLRRQYDWLEVSRTKRNSRAGSG